MWLNIPRVRAAAAGVVSAGTGVAFSHDQLPWSWFDGVCLLAEDVDAVAAEENLARAERRMLASRGM